MSATQISELRRVNYALFKNMDALLKRGNEIDPSTKKRSGLNPEQSQEWDAMDVEYDTRKQEIDQLEKNEKRREELAKLDDRMAGREIPEGDPPASDTNKDEIHSKALSAFLTTQPSRWDQETRDIVDQSQKDAPPEAQAMGQCFALMGPRPFKRHYGNTRLRELEQELRFLGIVTGGKGQETIPQQFMAELDVAMLDHSGILQAARVITTATGAAMPWPKVDDTSQIGELLAEDSTATEADPAFTGVTFNAFVYDSKAVRLANTLLQDSGFDLASLLAGMLGIRLGRIMNLHGTTGTGSSQPRGVVTAVLAETTPVAAASATVIVHNDLLNLEHAVDPAYRQRSVWMMHDSIVKHIKKLKDTTGRPLWAAGLSVREPDTINGYRWFVNQGMDSDPPAATEESILFGDFSKYIIRRVMNPLLVRLNELYALKFQTGFVMFDRWDSNLVDAGTGPIKVLQH